MGVRTDRALASVPAADRRLEQGTGRTADQGRQRIAQPGGRRVSDDAGAGHRRDVRPPVCGAAASAARTARDGVTLRARQWRTAWLKSTWWKRSIGRWLTRWS